MSEQGNMSQSADRDLDAASGRSEGLAGGVSRTFSAAARLAATARTAAQPSSPEAGTIGAADAPSRKRLIIGALVVVALILGAYELTHYFVYGRFIMSTDDAYIKTETTIIAPKIAGYLAAVEVVENQKVKAGDLLARIDDGDYKIALAAAQQKVLTQDTTIARIEAQIVAQAAQVDQARAQIDAANADVPRAAADFTRAQALLAAKFATPQRLDAARADRDRSVANSASAQAALAGAQASLAVLHSQKAEAVRARAELVTAQDKAARDLAFAEIRAPFDGVVGNKAAELGAFVQPGARLMALVPLGSAYVEANFKETQIGAIKPGQKATFRVDAYGGRIFEGQVQSLAPASGSEFSLLPPENATGNFTKITQRFPVRISVPAADAQAGLMRAGLSVVVEVDTSSPAKAQ